MTPGAAVFGAVMTFVLGYIAGRWSAREEVRARRSVDEAVEAIFAAVRELGPRPVAGPVHLASVWGTGLPVDPGETTTNAEPRP